MEWEEREWERETGIGLVRVMRKAEDAVLAGYFGQGVRMSD